MKNVNWKLIGIIVAIISWILTALYALGKRRMSKFWKEEWRKEMDKKLVYQHFSNRFAIHWRNYKDATNDFKKEWYIGSLNDDLANLDEYNKQEK